MTYMNYTKVARFPVELQGLGGRRDRPPAEVIEAALAHVVQNKVKAAYARSDLFERRRRLMADWASAIEST